MDYLIIISYYKKDRSALLKTAYFLRMMLASILMTLRGGSMPKEGAFTGGWCADRCALKMRLSELGET